MAKPKRSHFKTEQDFMVALNRHYRKNARQGATYIEAMNNFFDKRARRNAAIAFAMYHDHKDRVNGVKVKNYDMGTCNVQLFIDKMEPSHKYPMSQMKFTKGNCVSYIHNKVISYLPIQGYGYTSVPAVNAAYLMAA